MVLKCCNYLLLITAVIVKAITCLYHWNCWKTIGLYDLCWFGQVLLILFHETLKNKAPISYYFDGKVVRTVGMAVWYLINFKKK